MVKGAFGLSPAQAADLGGDCCADLEERVAELEATTVRKGNKKVSVTLSGWVIKSVNWWDDGSEQNVYVGDKDLALSSHFTISGSAQISPGWSAGYNMTVESPGGVFGFITNQFQDNAGVVTGIDGLNTLLSYMWIKSDKWGTLNWGQSSQATDNLALLVDLSGTVIESNAIFMEGAGFFLRPKGGPKGASGLEQANWSSFLSCSNLNAGADCDGLPTNNVRYDSPTWRGFSASTSYGEDDFWDIALKYASDWGPFKVSAAGGYTNMLDEGFIFGASGPPGFGLNSDFWQVGASIMHMPTGLWVYGAWEMEETNKPGFTTAGFMGSPIPNRDIPDGELWFMKAGIKRNWTPLGATVIWGEGGQYHNMYGGLQLQDVCANNGGSLGGVAGTNLNKACATNFVTVTDSTVNRWGLGVVQEIDSAAMHLFAKWQHQELDATFVTQSGKGVSQGFDDWDLFQAGGIIFF
jgi:hypothetical protein